MKVTKITPQKMQKFFFFKLMVVCSLVIKINQFLVQNLFFRCQTYIQKKIVWWSPGSFQSLG